MTDFLAAAMLTKNDTRALIQRNMCRLHDSIETGPEKSGSPRRPSRCQKVGYGNDRQLRVAKTFSQKLCLGAVSKPRSLRQSERHYTHCLTGFKLTSLQIRADHGSAVAGRLGCDTSRSTEFVGLESAVFTRLCLSGRTVGHKDPRVSERIPA